MKQVCPVILIFLSLSVAHAESKYCESGDDRAKVRLESRGADVLVQVTDAKFWDHGKVGNPKDGQLAVKSLEGISLLVSQVSLSELVGKRSSVAEEVVAKGLFTMTGFDGDYDMVNAYASDYVSNLVCHESQ